MNAAQRTQWLCDQASALGFDLCGVAPVEGLQELANLPEWLNRGFAGEMNYLRDVRRADPKLVLEGARSMIAVALNYNSQNPYSTKVASESKGTPPHGWISRYAWGDDYHDVIKPKLDVLVARMRAEFAEPFDARVYVDTGPIVERVAAKYAGLGWLAKNTCLINQKLGSWLFLGVVITTLALEPTLAAEIAPPRDLCGSCTRCLDACPTQAFPQPYVLDSRRCISYLTIELRGAIPEDLRSGMGNAVIGCDICQDVCPWNRKAPVTAVPEFQPRLLRRGAAEGNGRAERGKSLFAPQLEEIASLTQQDFSTIFRKSAVKRAKWRGLVRNACIAMGNCGPQMDSRERKRALQLLKKLAESDDAIITEHARWAAARLSAHTPETGETAR